MKRTRKQTLLFIAGTTEAQALAKSLVHYGAEAKKAMAVALWVITHPEEPMFIKWVYIYRNTRIGPEVALSALNSAGIQ